jgi:hypothetical protein
MRENQSFPFGTGLGREAPHNLVSIQNQFIKVLTFLDGGKWPKTDGLRSSREDRVDVASGCCNVTSGRFTHICLDTWIMDMVLMEASQPSFPGV